MSRTALLVALAGLATPTLADNRNWANPASGTFNTSANWSPASVPGSEDRATFNQSANYTVTMPNANTTNSELSVRNDSVAFNLFGRVYTLTSTAQTCFSIGGSVVGHGSSGHVGSLTLFNSSAGPATLNTTSANIGGTAGAGGSGTVRVQPNVVWNNSGFIFVGSSAPGNLYLSGGDVNTFATVIGQESPGLVTVGVGSQWIHSSSLDVGGNANGTMNISTTGVVRCDEALIGGAAGVTGSVSVSGGMSLFDTDGPFTLGLNGAGYLTVSTGGAVQAGIGAVQCSIADGSGSTGSLTITGSSGSTPSRMTFISGPTHFGRMGSATININGGGKLDHTSHAYLASHPLGTCNVTIGGVGSRWVPGADMYVGGTSSAPGGVASLGLTNFGFLQIGSAGTLKVWPGSSVILDNGIIQTGSFINQGTLNWISGTFQLLTNCTVGSSGPFGAAPVINTGKVLQASGFTINGNAATNLSIPGGTVISDFDTVIGSTSQGAAALSASGQFISRGLTIGQSSTAAGSLSADGPGTHLNLGEFPFNQDIYIGKAGTGSLTVSNGALATVAYNPFNIGNDANSHGSVTITGPSSQLSLAEYYLSVGRYGEGTVDVLAGARLNGAAFIAENPGSTGNVHIAGNSIWTSPAINAGTTGAATLTIDSGSDVSTGDFFSAMNTASTADITLTGAGSTLTSATTQGHYGQLIVGGAGPATMLIDQSAAATCVESFIGDGSTATGTVTLRNNATLTASDGIAVAYNGRATLNIESGADVTTNSLIAGVRIGSQGAINLTGAGSTLSATTATIGGGQSGVLNIANGALAQTSGTCVVQATGSINLAGGTLNANYLNHGGQLTGTGTVAANLTNAGTIAPGNSAGTITVQGPYTQAANGVLNIELGGTAPGTQHDQLAISGNASLGGTLNVSIINNYQPRRGDSFTILTSQSRAGAFTTINLPTLPAGSLRVTYTATAVIITFCYANCDGSTVSPVLTANDFQCFLNKYASGSPYANCDGSTVAPVLTANDFQCFLNQYAAGCS